MATELHRWTLDESGSTITDHVGSSNGTVNGTPDETDGILDGARYFGTGEYVDCGNPSSLNFGSSNFTIRSIFRRGITAASDDQYICSKHTVASPGYALYIDATSYTIEFVIYFSGAPYTVSAADNFAEDRKSVV